MNSAAIGAIRPGVQRDVWSGPKPRPAHVRPQRSRRAARPLTGLQLILCVLAPFAFGYFLSYVFRTINALLAGTLSRELDVGPSELGLLTSVYFLAIAAVQLPLGAMLDRYGPRRVQGWCLLVAAAGAALFAMADGFVALVIGRALIGIGIATALMAGLKAAVLWFSAERIAFANGLIVMTGALGAVAATLPSEQLIAAIGWRGLFLVLAALCVVACLLILTVVPEREAPVGAPASGPAVSLAAIYSDPRCLRLAPLSALLIGTAWSLQGLWIAPWLADVERMGRDAVVGHLLLMGIALAAGALGLGCGEAWARRRGATRDGLFAVLAFVFVLAQVALIARAPVPLVVCLATIAAAGAATVLSYAILPGYFPKAMSARANGALNILHMSAAFLIQWLTGALIECWSPVDGRPPLAAYQTAFGIGAALQTAALAWFLWPRVWSRQKTYGCTAQHSARHVARADAIAPSGYELALAVWAQQVADARSSRIAWRTSGLGSITLTALLVVQLIIAASPTVLPYIVNIELSDSATSTGPSANVEGSQLNR